MPDNNITPEQVPAVKEQANTSKHFDRSHKSSDDLFRSLFISSPIGIYIVQNGTFKAVNPQFQIVTGYSEAELFDLTPLDLILPEDRTKVHQNAVRMLKGLQPSAYEYRIVTKKGEIKWIMETVASILYQGFPASLGNFMDITERKQVEEQLRFLSVHDPLTGTYNRVYFEEEMRRLSSERFIPVGMIMCDVDGLKLINDTMGHDSGDELLKKTSYILKNCVRSSDVVARVGGDEFAILLPNAPEEVVKAICERIKTATDWLNTKETTFNISLSLGYAIKKDPACTMKDLFKQADNNMYRERFLVSGKSSGVIINSLLEKIHRRDFASYNHIERLSEIVCALGQVLGMGEQSYYNIKLLAEFHDIGKIGISEDLLFKPTRLTREELAEIRRHSEIGHRIAIYSPDLMHIAELILKHHEWWNGNGYPLGLSGNNIPLECRIHAVAEAYEAMTGGRPYRLAMSAEQALVEIERGAGSQFDPYIVQVFINMLTGKLQ